MLHECTSADEFVTKRTTQQKMTFQCSASNRWQKNMAKSVYIAFAVILGNFTGTLLMERWGREDRVDVVPHHVELPERQRDPDMKQLTPTIGVLAQGGDVVFKIIAGHYKLPRYTEYGNSFIPTSYARFVQSGGIVFHVLQPFNLV